jgi:hypothetical protein
VLLLTLIATTGGRGKYVGKTDVVSTCADADVRPRAIKV